MNKVITPEIEMFLREEYINNKKSTRQIGEMLEKDHAVISKMLRMAGIKVRSKAEQARYTWKHHKHPHIGLKGKDAYWAYGRAKSAEEIEKHRKKNSGALNYRWKGGRRGRGDGYVLVYSPDHPCAGRDKAILEHRLIMEQFIGRYLEPWECVHHKNGVKDDNRIENLELMNRETHARLHMEQRYGKEAANE